MLGVPPQRESVLGCGLVTGPVVSPSVYLCLVHDGGRVKASQFEYHRPGSLDEAVELLAQYGSDAQVLAGGQSLVPLLALRQVRPGVSWMCSGLSSWRCFGGPTE